MTRTRGSGSPPAACRRCGDGPRRRAGDWRRSRHQFTDIGRAPPPVVTEYVAQGRSSARAAAAVSEGRAAAVRAGAGPASGPETLRAGREPGQRATTSPWAGPRCCCATWPGVAASTGWMAGIRGRAAALVAESGFTDRVRELLTTAPAVHADETPARAAGGMRYVHLACTAYLTACTPGPVRGRHRRRRRPARLRRGHRPGRLLRLRPSHRCAARLVRRPLGRYCGYADTGRAGAGGRGWACLRYRHNRAGCGVTLFFPTTGEDSEHGCSVWGPHYGAAGAACEGHG